METTPMPKITRNLKCATLPRMIELTEINPPGSFWKKKKKGKLILNANKIECMRPHEAGTDIETNNSLYRVKESVAEIIHIMKTQ